MIASTNPVVANALGLNSGVALNTKICADGDWKDAKKAWERTAKEFYILASYLYSEQQPELARQVELETERVYNLINKIGYTNSKTH